MMTRFSRFFCAAVMSSLFATSCVKTIEGEYQDPKVAEIIDDKWNEADAHKTAEILINSMVSKPWLEEYQKSGKGKRPVLLVDDVENRTDEHIDTKALTEFIRDELVNSGKIRFVDAAKREKILSEIKYQQSGAVNKATAKQTGKQTGADFMLGGGISSQVHKMDDIKTVTYLTNLTLTDFETGEIVWSQKYEVKKKFKRSGSGW
jgi:penicillin-binding protein activator